VTHGHATASATLEHLIQIAPVDTFFRVFTIFLLRSGNDVVIRGTTAFVAVSLRDPLHRIGYQNPRF
jgi:hypothetical protein